MQIVICLYESVSRLKPQGAGLSLQIQSISIYLKPKKLVSPFFFLFYIEFLCHRKNQNKNRKKEGDKHYSKAENLIDTVLSTIRKSITICVVKNFTTLAKMYLGDELLLF